MSYEASLISILMRKNFYLVVGLIALAYVINSFFTDKETDEILWMEMNIWYYRLFWAGSAILMIVNYFALRKAEKKSEE